MGTVSGCCPELRRKMHGREPSHPSKIGESDALFEMRADIVLDSLYPPLGQGFTECRGSSSRATCMTRVCATLST